MCLQQPFSQAGAIWIVAGWARLWKTLPSLQTHQSEKAAVFTRQLEMCLTGLQWPQFFFRFRLTCVLRSSTHKLLKAKVFHSSSYPKQLYLILWITVELCPVGQRPVVTNPCLQTLCTGPLEPVPSSKQFSIAWAKGESLAVWRAGPHNVSYTHTSTIHYIPPPILFCGM